jgi:hypothetical protein
MVARRRINLEPPAPAAAGRGRGPPARLLILAVAARSSAARAPWRGDEPARGGAVEMSRQTSMA